MNQPAFFLNQDQESSSANPSMNPFFMYTQLAQGNMPHQGHWAQFSPYPMHSGAMMDPAMQEQFQKKFMHDWQMFQENFFKVDGQGNHYDYYNYMKGGYGNGIKEENNMNENGEYGARKDGDYYKYNYNSFARQQGVKKIGSYSVEERAKKIKKYKDKLIRWKQANPISRSFSGRSQVANKKPRVKGRFVKNDDESEDQKSSQQHLDFKEDKKIQNPESTSDNQLQPINEKEHHSSIETMQEFIEKNDDHQGDQENSETVDNKEQQQSSLKQINYQTQQQQEKQQTHEQQISQQQQTQQQHQQKQIQDQQQSNNLQHKD